MDGFIGEIRMVGYPWAPRNWYLCMGGVIDISQHTTLYSLIGTIYGGDGRVSFQLPDLRGRTPIGQGMHPGSQFNYIVGQFGGLEKVQLTLAQMPQHHHSAGVSGNFTATPQYSADTAANVTPSTGETLGKAQVKPSIGTGDDVKSFGPANNLVDGHAIPVTGAGAISVGDTGGSQSHTNIQPYLVVNFVICYDGDYPSRN